MNFAEPLKIDENLTLETRILPSPMAGVMGPVYCRAASEMGLIRNWFMPFLSITEGSVPSRAALRRKLAPYRNGKALIAQILGHDPASMAETAKRLAETGAAGINLNFACPAPMVLKNGNGGAVLAKPGHMAEIAAAVVQAAGSLANISVKIRAGAESPDELPAIAGALNAAGVRFVICHFRTVREMYARVEDPLPRLARLRRLLPPETVLFGNGDIDGPDAAETMCRETGCAGATVGRALVSDPFVLRKIERSRRAEVTPEERLDFLRHVLESARALNRCSGRWMRTSFLGFVRMCIGGETPQFREIASDPFRFAEKLTGEAGK